MEQVSFERFTENEYRAIQQKLFEPPERIPLGGIYYGQVRTGDICHHACIAHVPPEHQVNPKGEDVLNLSFFCFVPTDPMDMGNTYYAKLMDDHKIDYVPDADITFTKEEIAVMIYPEFCREMDKMVGRRVYEVPRLREPSGHTSPFWQDVDRYGKGKILIPRMGERNQRPAR